MLVVRAGYRGLSGLAVFIFLQVRFVPLDVCLCRPGGDRYRDEGGPFGVFRSHARPLGGCLPAVSERTRGVR